MLCLKYLLLFIYLVNRVYIHGRPNSPTTVVVIDRLTIDFKISDNSCAQTADQNYYKTL